MQGTRVSFKSKEDAIHFAEKQGTYLLTSGSSNQDLPSFVIGWQYYVQEPHKARIPPKNYSANYLYSPTKLRIARTK